MGTRSAYHRQLRGLAGQVVSLGSAVLDNLGRAPDALIRCDLGLDDDVLQTDDRIDEFAKKLESDAVEVLALEAPVASELHYVVSLLRLCYELERCGDLLVNVARAAHRLRGPVREDLARSVTGLAEKTRDLFERALGTYAAAEAADFNEADDEVDDAHAALLAALEKPDVDHRTIIALTIAGRCYERIADHAVNLAERSRLVSAAPLDD